MAVLLLLLFTFLLWSSQRDSLTVLRRAMSRARLSVQVMRSTQHLSTKRAIRWRVTRPLLRSCRTVTQSDATAGQWFFVGFSETTCDPGVNHANITTLLPIGTFSGGCPVDTCCDMGFAVCIKNQIFRTTFVFPNI